MTEPDPAAGGNQNPTPQYRDAETALGGADAVEKTSYVTGSGTSPEAMPIAGVTVPTPSGGGVNLLAWAVGAIAIIIGLVYLVPLFRS
jgi:hypothetical protein